MGLNTEGDTTTAPSSKERLGVCVLVVLSPTTHLHHQASCNPKLYQDQEPGTSLHWGYWCILRDLDLQPSPHRHQSYRLQCLQGMCTRAERGPRASPQHGGPVHNLANT